MNKIAWIKLVTDLFDDEKIILIESMPNADSILVIWIKLLCLAGKQNNQGVFKLNSTIPYSKSMFASIFRRSEQTIEQAFDTFAKFGMIEYIDNTVSIPNWGKYQTTQSLDLIREQTKKRVANYRQRQKDLASNVTVTLPLRNVTPTDKIRKEEDIDKDIDKKKERQNILLEQTSFSLPLKNQLKSWLTYKAERNEPYTKTSLPTLFDCITENVKTFGDDAVCKLIRQCIAQNWRSIVWEKLTNTKTTKPTIFQDDYDYDDIERQMWENLKKSTPQNELD